MRKFYDCAVCMDVIPDRHIWSCQKCSTNICSSCSMRIKKNNQRQCVQCRHDLDSHTGTFRNRTLEQLADSFDLKFPCEHHGCNAELPRTEIRHHQENCIYQPIKCSGCLGTTCNATFKSWNDFWHHYQTAHRLTVGVSPPTTTVPIFRFFTESILCSPDTETVDQMTEEEPLLYRLKDSEHCFLIERVCVVYRDTF